MLIKASIVIDKNIKVDQKININKTGIVDKNINIDKNNKRYFISFFIIEFSSFF